MSPYLIILCVSVLSVFIASEKRYIKPTYTVLFAAMTMFLALRFGQGTDWFGYSHLYNGAPSSFDFDSVYYTDAYHTEFGWKLLFNAFKCLDINFSWITFVLALLDMLLLNRFISRYSTNRTMSLLLVFPTVYLTYFFSGLREGLVIAVFLGYIVGWAEEQKTIRCIICIAILATIHQLSWVLLLVLVARFVSKRRVPYILGASAAIGLAGPLWMGTVLSIVDIGYSGAGISFVPLAYRLFMLVLIVFLYRENACMLETSRKSKLDYLMGIYLLGIAVYLCLMTNSIVASRFAITLLCVEIAIFPILVTEFNSRQLWAIFFAIIFAVCMMTIKNIDSYVSQGCYNSSISVWNYPYVSVFNQDEIYGYRSGALIELE